MLMAEKKNKITPRISVVMAIYKEPIEWIKQAIDSIINQTFGDFEFIIINDNPFRKENCELLEDYLAKDSRIRVIVNDNNIGLTKSLNKGLEVAKGEYIARMDADDISMPDRFEKQVKFMDKHLTIGVLGSAVEYFGNRSGIHTYPYDHDDVYLFIETCFAHPSVLIRREILQTHRYDETLSVSQDYCLWEELYASGVKFANLKESLLMYRCTDAQISATKNNLQRSISQKIRRRAFDNFCLGNNYECFIGNNPISIQMINKIEDQVYLPKQVKNTLMYYLFLSVDTQKLSYIHEITKKLLSSSISLDIYIKLLYHRLLNHGLILF